MTSRLIIPASKRLRLNELWTPEQISLIGWFDASVASSITESASKVSKWADLSPNNFDIEQLTGGQKPNYADADKKINGMNTVHFFNQENLLGQGFPNYDSTTGISIITVGAHLGAYVLGEFVHARSTDQSDSLFMRRDSSTNTLSVNFVGDGTANNFPRVKISDASLAPPTPVLSNVYYDNDKYYVRANGGALSSNRDTVNNITFTVNELGMGTLNGNATDVIIGESVFVPASDLATMEKVEGYLAWKWGLVGSLDASHSYKDLPPLV